MRSPSSASRRSCSRACSSSGGSSVAAPAASRRRLRRAARARADQDRLPAEGHRQQYFAAAKPGVDKAAKETAAPSSRSDPNEAKADLQVPFITTSRPRRSTRSSSPPTARTGRADLKAAMDAGIKVVGFDSSPAVGAYNVFVNQIDFSGIGGSTSPTGPATSPRIARRDRDPVGDRHGDQPEQLDRPDMKTLSRTPSTRASSSSTPSTAMTTRRRARPRRRPCSPSTRTSRSSSRRRPSASWRRPRSCRRPRSRTASR